MSKFDDAKNKVSRKSGEVIDEAGKPVNQEPSVMAKFDSAVIIESLSMEEFAQAVKDGAELGEKYLEIEPGEMFRAFFLGTSDGFIEDGGKPKAIRRLHFEWATKDKVGTGVNFSLLEYAQLKSQISDVLPHDGSAFVLVGKGEMGKSKRSKRQLQDWAVARFPSARSARRVLTAASGAAAHDADKTGE